MCADGEEEEGVFNTGRKSKKEGSKKKKRKETLNQKKEKNFFRFFLE